MGRIVRPADFQRVLGTPPWARSRHFAVHHLRQAPSLPEWRARPTSPLSTELSTDAEHACPQPVDGSGVEFAVAGVWLGLVVPKRHARRSVTRSLLKRQIRAAVAAAAQPTGPGLEAGMWVVRLRSPIDRKQYPSAASDALRAAMHGELQLLIDQAVRRCHG